MVAVLVRATIEAALALTPGLLLWVIGRRFRRRLDDPLLAERLAATNRPALIASAVAAAGIATMSIRALVWAVPVMYLSSLAGGLPLRRALFGETWSLATYLWFRVRLYVAWVGLATVILIAPAAVPTGGTAAIAIDVVIAILLVLWVVFTDVVLRRCLRARVIDRPDLADALADLSRRSGARSPRFEYAPLEGGVLPNAAAVPGIGRSTVLFFQTLLDQLDPAAIVAIAAHEIAHLEYYEARIWRMKGFMALTAVTAVALPFGFDLAGDPVGRGVMLAGWFTGLLAVMAVRAPQRRRNETASDVRAVELTGDPEALIRGLTALYATARLVRRKSPEDEQRGTHPSLARRIQAIRRAAGIAPTTLDAPVSVRSTDGTRLCTFHGNYLEWADDRGGAALPYSRVVEGRVTIKRRRPTLMVTELHGPTRLMTISAASVPAISAALNVVDQQFAAREAPARTQLARFAALGAALVSALVLQPIGILLGGLTLFKPETPLAIAAGVSALLWGIHSAMTGAGASPVGESRSLGVVLALFGVALVWAGWSRRRERLSRTSYLAAIGVAACALLMIAGVVLEGPEPVWLHGAVIAWPSSIVLPLAAGAAMLALPRRSLKIAALCFLAAGAGLAYVGTPSFLKATIHGPLAQDAPTLRTRAIQLTHVADVPLDDETSDVVVSDSGRSIAIGLDRDDTDSEETSWRIGRVGGTLHDAHGVSAYFAPDDDVDVFMVSSMDDASTLTRVNVEDGRTVWTAPLPGLVSPIVAFDGAGGWRAADSLVADRLRVIDGDIANGRGGVADWPTPVDRGLSVVAVSQGAVLVDRIRASSTPWNSAAWTLLRPLRYRFPVRHHLAVVTPAGQTDLGETAALFDCARTRRLDAAPICSLDDGDVVRLLAVDLAHGRWSPIAQMPSTMSVNAASSEWPLIARGASAYAAFDPAASEALTWPDAPDGMIWLSSANGARVVLTEWADHPVAHIFTWR